MHENNQHRKKITSHKLGKIIIPIIGILLWLFLSNNNDKMFGLIISIFFILTEFNFTAATTIDKNGVYQPTPLKYNIHKGHTSWEQFWANILYIPVVFPLYYKYIKSPFLRVILFPIFVWLMEIIEGYSLMGMYGYNPAWSYFGKWAFFNGNINLSYVFSWLMSGIVMELLIKVLPPIIEKTSSYYWVGLIFFGLLNVLWYYKKHTGTIRF